MISCQAIEVPETLLKKRKQNEKIREEKLAAAASARKVRNLPASNTDFLCMMHTNTFDERLVGPPAMLPFN